MKLGYSRNLMLNMISKKPGIGKTAAMKYTFILQCVLGMELGYDFDIYTYGPYSSDAAADLDTLIFYGYIDAQIREYGKFSGYELSLTKKGEDVMEPLVPGDADEQNLSRVLDLFGDKTARSLELSSTILYLASLYERNKWETTKDDNLISSAKEIKPHFTNDEIEEACKELKNNRLLNGRLITL